MLLFLFSFATSGSAGITPCSKKKKMLVGVVFLALVLLARVEGEGFFQPDDNDQVTPTGESRVICTCPNDRDVVTKTSVLR